MNFCSISTSRILASSHMQSLSGCMWYALHDQMKLVVLLAFCAMFNASNKSWILNNFNFLDLLCVALGRRRCMSVLNTHFALILLLLILGAEKCDLCNYACMYFAFHASQKVLAFICLCFLRHSSIYYLKMLVFAWCFQFLPCCKGCGCENLLPLDFAWRLTMYILFGV